MAKILIVEDNEGYLNTLKTEFGMAGFEVIAATDAEDALEQAKEGQPDAILLDVILPKRTGISVLQDLKRFEDTKNIPVFITSSYADEKNQKKALDAGATSFIPKDKFDVPHIIQRIKKYLEHLSPSN